MQFANVVRVISFLARCTYTRIFCVCTCTRVGAACVTRRAHVRVLVASHKRTHAGDERDRKTYARAWGPRHCKRMLIIFTSCNSVTLNHRQATLCASPAFPRYYRFPSRDTPPRDRDHHRRGHVRPGNRI